jgi:hypothetical protein
LSSEFEVLAFEVLEFNIFTVNVFRAIQWNEIENPAPEGRKEISPALQRWENW